MLHKIHYANYVDDKTLEKLSDYIFMNNMLSPFFEHLFLLMQFPGVMQCIYDSSVPIDEKHATKIFLKEVVSGRLFDNLIVNVDMGEHQFTLQEITRRNYEKLIIKDESIHYTILPDMSFLDESFKELFVDVFEKIAKIVEEQNKIISLSDETAVNTNSHHRKSREKKNILSRKKRYNQEDIIFQFLLDDVLPLSCNTLDAMKDDPWTREMRKLDPWTQFMERFNNIPLTGDREKLKKFIFDAIRFIFYMHIKNAYQNKYLEFLLEESQSSKKKSPGKDISGSRPGSSASSSAQSKSPEQKKFSSLLTSSINSLWLEKSSDDSRSRSASFPSTERSKPKKLFSGSDSGATTNTVIANTTSTTTTTTMDTGVNFPRK